MSAPVVSKTPEGAGGFLSPRRLLRGLLVLIVVAMVVGVFYAVENRRGSQAWERFKAESAAKGINMDWNAYVPPKVPDDQNFFKATNMENWFTGYGGTALSARLDYRNLYAFLEQRGFVPSVDVTVVPANAPVPPENADLVLDYRQKLLSLADPPADSGGHTVPNRKQGHLEISGAAVEKIFDTLNRNQDPTNADEHLPKLREIFAPLVVLGLKPLEIVPPRRIVVRADGGISTDEIEDLVAAGLKSKPRAISTGANSWRLPLDTPHRVPAAEYLAWSDSFQADFAAIHTALERPYARMDGNYETPVTVPVPNFLTLRAAAQTLALRTQCYLLLGEPEKALRELTQMHNLCRLLEGRPTGQPMTMLPAMLNVTVRGLYVDIAADGLNLHLWREPQLATIQQQLAQTDLAPYLYRALQVESVGFGRMVENTKASALAGGYYGVLGQSFWVLFYLRFAPHEWLLQNAIVSARLQQKMLGAIDPTNHLVFPKEVAARVRDIERLKRRPTPYSFLASRFIPNYVHSVTALAKTQTLVNEAMIVCALERYRLVHGNYPGSLDQLVPEFAEKLPHDLFGGRALKYRVEGGKFVLYSIGWNERDDGGIPGWIGDLTTKDWTWPYEEAGAK